jgi:SAM-dependent methyltransferase
VNPDDDPDDVAPSIRAEYERLGADAFYRKHGRDYRNPHEDVIGLALDRAVKQWAPDLSNVLDLACGSGEVTLSIRQLGAQNVQGIDPFTFEAYQSRTGQIAERWSFEDIASSQLIDRRYSLIVCSFALHLCDASRLPGVLTQLSLIAPQLWILTPHKRPQISPAWGWTLQAEMVVARVRIRNYFSTGIV